MVPPAFDVAGHVQLDLKSRLLLVPRGVGHTVNTTSVREEEHAFFVADPCDLVEIYIFEGEGATDAVEAYFLKRGDPTAGLVWIGAASVVAVVGAKMDGFAVEDEISLVYPELAEAERLRRQRIQLRAGAGEQCRLAGVEVGVVEIPEARISPLGFSE